MSADLVPGCIRRLAFASMMLCSIVGSWVAELPRDGDLGPIWISVGGGGLGSRGKLAGRDIFVVAVAPLCQWHPVGRLQLCMRFEA